MASPVLAVQRGAHSLGVPVHPVVPRASNAYSLWSSAPAYTTPFATAGDDRTLAAVVPRQIGMHAGTEPPVLVHKVGGPAASKASRSSDPT